MSYGMSLAYLTPGRLRGGLASPYPTCTYVCLCTTVPGALCSYYMDELEDLRDLQAAFLAALEIQQQRPAEGAEPGRQSTKVGSDNPAVLLRRLSLRGVPSYGSYCLQD
jgi:hypothetical protein